MGPFQIGITGFIPILVVVVVRWYCFSDIGIVGIWCGQGGGGVGDILMIGQT